jgi:pimeloyl-ACP methyl ester carboxylesterase
VTGTVDRRVDGLAVYDRSAPPGSPRVVLVHGSMDRAASFIKVVRRLPELEIVRYDRRGYGRSLAAGVDETIDEQVADLLAVAGPGPTSVVGHSLGGVIAVAAAVRRPEVLVSVGAFESPMSWRPQWPSSSAGGNALRETDDAEAAERFMRGILGDAVWERLPSSTRTARRAEGHALVAELAALRAAAPYDPDRVRVPVVTGYGSRSKPYHQEAARRLAEEVPDGEVVVVADAGHGAHTSHPEQFAAFVRRVVERGGGPGLASGPCPTCPP